MPVAIPERLRSLFDGLWRSPGYHHLPDGTVTSIRQRPVPSAGAAYPVHTHLVVGSAGLDGLDPGRYLYDHENGHLLRRVAAREPATGWDIERARPATAQTTLVLTVQPGRSFGRYRHRAWPLWIADVAYAQTAVEFLITQHLKTSTGPGPLLRALLGVPRAACAQPWLSRGLVPEIPLAAVELPPSWTVDADRSHALATRRSPALSEFEQATGRRPEPRAVEVARLSGQGWVLGADRVETWSVPAQAPAQDIAGAVWQAHRRAASLCYDGTLSGRWRSRPISGIAAGHGRWITHALAMLPASGHRHTNDAQEACA
ncbi:hypothetical protein DI005_07165 [Prauserella sp. PE36]|uniref:Uncharacterized protein n=1 Tax=Prauserella endophytica TaxID=1592324 RepID=A0ABY2S704_9PSEU|nr:MULTISPECIES: hypothetical protein [Prauserella]RBM22277.1 hypothetical protein DI005_07165 [Prauserella sp. PE36]TKG71709.1 hypothetical protein FCN18_09345 [Prauserella endophytica]